jgi:hypothetical protein
MAKKKNNEESLFPHEECENCKGLGDCPYREVDFFGSPQPPEECLSFTDRMKQVEKQKKHGNI